MHIHKAFHVMPLILASTSATRIRMLDAVRIPFTVQPSRVDEESIRRALESEQARPRDIADTLAEMKARKIAEKCPADHVLGCDQILDLHGEILSKPRTSTEAFDQLCRLRGQTHKLLSAVVLYHDARPVWRHVGEAKMTMRQMSDDTLRGYVARNWPGIGESVGGYKIEEEGARLFSAIDGDHFTILGLPLLPLLGYLGDRGLIPT